MFFLSGDFGGVFVRKQHVFFEFIAGNELRDPEKFPEGTGKYRRHLKLYSQEDIETKNVAYYVDKIK